MSLVRPTRRCLSLPLLLVLALPAVAQGPAADVARARPERPTVATHAFAVARGHLEIEAGVSGAAAKDAQRAATVLAKMGVAPRLQLSVAVERTLVAAETAAPDPLFAGVKWQLGKAAEGRPQLALLPGVTLNTGASGGESAAVSLTGVASHAIGPVGFDFNLAATRLNGVHGAMPYLWAAAATLPLAGRLGWGVEVSGERAEGSEPSTHALAFLNFALHPGLVLDAGWTRATSGGADHEFFAGLTWHAGRVFRR